MSIFEWADQKVKTRNIWDIGVLKIFCTLVGMILGAYLSTFVIQNVWWFGAVSAVLFIWLMIRFFKT